jgi:fructose-1-phosphate kinase PfkB-like protein
MLEGGGADVVIVTLAAEGELLASKEGAFRMRAPQVELVTAVRAGDAS